MNKLLHKGSKVIQRDAAKLVPIGREDTAHDNEQLVPRKLGDRSSRKIKKCRIANVQYPIMNEECKMLKKEQENNIPVLRTCGYHGEPCATNIDGALHLGFQTTGTAISETAAAPRNTLSDIQWNCRTSSGETAAAPRNICRTACRSSERKVQRTETLNGNMEYRIMNKESGRKIPVQGRLIPEGLHVYRKAVNRENSTPAGVAQIVVLYRFYKRLMPACSANRPPASGSQKTEGERVRGCESERVRNGEIVIENNNQYSMMNEETGNNIPVLRTLGYNAVSYSTKITGALHLGFQHTGIAISETAAAPRNTLSGIQWICRTSNGETAAAPQNTLSGNRRICRTAGHPSGKKVQRTETLKNITVQVTAQDTRRLGNALGDKKTKTNSKKVKR